MSLSDSSGRSVALQPGEGQSLSFWGLSVVFKVRGEDTGGAYTIFEFTSPPHAPGPPPHIHDNCDECFYVLDGTLKLYLGGQKVSLGPRGFAMAPKGTAHNPESGGDDPLRGLGIMSPAGFEGYYDELAALATNSPPGPPPRDKMGEISERYGVVYLPPQGVTDNSGHSVALQSGEGQSLSFWGLNMTFKVRGEDTGGAYAIYEMTVPPHIPGPPPHIHDNCDECFYVLEGTLKLHLDGQEMMLGPGGFARVPRGTLHNPENSGDVPLRALTIISPAIFEGYFDELAALAASLPPGPPPRDKMGEISERYGVVYLSPE